VEGPERLRSPSENASPRLEGDEAQANPPCSGPGPLSDEAKLRGNCSGPLARSCRELVSVIGSAGADSSWGRGRCWGGTISVGFEDSGAFPGRHERRDPRVSRNFRGHRHSQPPLSGHGLPPSRGPRVESPPSGIETPRPPSSGISTPGHSSSGWFRWPWGTTLAEGRSASRGIRPSCARSWAASGRGRSRKTRSEVPGVGPRGHSTRRILYEGGLRAPRLKGARPPLSAGPPWSSRFEISEKPRLPERVRGGAVVLSSGLGGAGQRRQGTPGASVGIRQESRGTHRPAPGGSRFP